MRGGLEFRKEFIRICFDIVTRAMFSIGEWTCDLCKKRWAIASFPRRRCIFTLILNV